MEFRIGFLYQEGPYLSLVRGFIRYKSDKGMRFAALAD